MTKSAPAEPDSLRKKLRAVIRDYYNNTFEYAIEQFQKGGDITALIANAESKQRELDDPYLDQILTLIEAHTADKVREARLNEIELIDKQFPDLWVRNRIEYTEKDMWKLARYVANRPDKIRDLNNSGGGL